MGRGTFSVGGKYGRVNFGKRGVSSISFGPRGARLRLQRDGRVKAALYGGTGPFRAYYEWDVSGKVKPRDRVPLIASDPDADVGWRAALLAVGVVATVSAGLAWGGGAVTVTVVVTSVILVVGSIVASLRKWLKPDTPSENAILPGGGAESQGTSERLHGLGQEADALFKRQTAAIEEARHTGDFSQNSESALALMVAGFRSLLHRIYGEIKARFRNPIFSASCVDSARLGA